MSSNNKLSQIMEMFISKFPSRVIFPKFSKFKPDGLFDKREKSLTPSKSIIWNIGKEQNGISDHFEMAGFFASAIISYAKIDNNLNIVKHLTIPTLRMKPNRTSSSYAYNFKNMGSNIEVNGDKILNEKPQTVEIKGNLKFTSTNNKVEIEREFIISTDYPALIEKTTITNTTNLEAKVTISNSTKKKTIHKIWTMSSNAFVANALICEQKFDSNSNIKINKTLLPKQSFTYFTVYFALEQSKSLNFDVIAEISKRDKFISNSFNNFVLNSSYPEIDAMFSHTIHRATESIFKTKNGYMHSPGGGGFYAALWTNDQCEYANPLFPYTGYDVAIKQSINCYRLYSNYMDKSDKPMKEKLPLISSIISEGDSFWNGAGDRGDAAMYAYGLSRFLLAQGDKKLAKEFLTELDWCLDFCFSRMNEEGVVFSDRDELEGRFPTGDYNLCTNSLFYDALNNCSIIMNELGKTDRATYLMQEYHKLHSNIVKYFCGNVMGFDTYKYYKGNDILRSWICMPMTVGIDDYSEGTIKALFSDNLYKNTFLKTAANNATTWDRSLLFAMRGTFLVNKPEVGFKILRDYSQDRLLGTHSPYPFEAYPEGNRAQLSAESALYARIITEGIFGFKPISFTKLKITPSLSKENGIFSLKNITIFNKKIDVSVSDTQIKIKYNNLDYSIDAKQAIFDFENLQFLKN